jgi:hypothetical protein
LFCKIMNPNIVFIASTVLKLPSLSPMIPSA